MKAAYILRTGSPSEIIYGDLPAPIPNAGQCLIKVAAVDVNPIDIYVRSGMAKTELTFPYILGRDLAGVVVECGSKVTRFKPGDRVWATNQGYAGRPGTFSELAVVDECWMHPAPAGIKDEAIVAISLTGITTHLGLVREAALKPGETLFVNGGAGGIGSCVVQMAKLLGAKVMATAGSDEKVAACLELGADLAVNYKTANVDDAIRKFASAGINVWWETVREPDLDRVIRHLAFRGRMVVMAGRDARPALPVGPFYTKDCSLRGFAMFNSTAEEQRTAADSLIGWLAAGKIQPRIDRILPLSDAALAHQLQEDSTVRKSGVLSGKIVLRP